MEELIDPKITAKADTIRKTAGDGRARTYLKAMTTNSKAAGIKAQCEECVGWTNAATQIRACVSTTCPLYPHRPFKE